MDPVQPNEIRIVLRGGLLQCVGLGKDVPRDIRVVLTDHDIEGRDPAENPNIQDDGYGEIAYCRVVWEPGADRTEANTDENGVSWV
ncbi:hypothetical protein HS125_11310 [bacterium]|nr:hypothetical protein [bacterium]